MRTARRAAPLLPENNDGSSYLYISLSDPTPESNLEMRRTRLAMRVPSTYRRHATLVASLLSLRRVKRLTHIAHELQARLDSMNDLHDALALRCLRPTRRDFLQ